MFGRCGANTEFSFAFQDVKHLLGVRMLVERRGLAGLEPTMKTSVTVDSEQMRASSFTWVGKR